MLAIRRLLLPISAAVALGCGASNALAYDLSSLPQNTWARFPVHLLDATADSGYSSRSWNRLTQDPTTGRFYQWEGWNQFHADPSYGFPYTQRLYEIYSNMLVSFSVPQSIDASGNMGLEVVAINSWSGEASTSFTPRNPANDHPKMKVPSPTDRHPYGTMVYDSVRHGFWQWAGVNNGVVPVDTWFFDLTAEVWSEKTPAHSPTAMIPSHTLYLPDQDRVLLLGPNGGDWLELWTYDIAKNDWTQSAAFAALGVAGYNETLLWDDKRKRVHVFLKKPPSGQLARFDYDPATDSVNVEAPAASPEGYSPEAIFDAKRDRVVCLAATADPEELWSYDFGANAFSKLPTSGDAPHGPGTTAWQLAYDEVNDVYVVFRSAGTVHLIRPAGSVGTGDAGAPAKPDGGVAGGVDGGAPTTTTMTPASDNSGCSCGVARGREAPVTPLAILAPLTLLARRRRRASPPK